MSMQEILASIDRVTRLGTARSLINPRWPAQNSTLLEGVYDERGHVPPHYHDCEEIILCTDGEGILFIGEDPHTIVSGTALVVPVGVPHCLYNTGIGRLHLLAFLPTADPEFHWVPSLRRTAENAESPKLQPHVVEPERAVA